MSAYIVDDKVIDYVLTAFVEYSRPYSPSICLPIFGEGEAGYKTFDLNVEADRNALGQMIVDENYASVNYRYREDDKPHRYKFRQHRAVLAANNRLPVIVQAIKSIDNIDYQSCEHPGWRQSMAREALVCMKDRLAARLPGYDNADWGAPDHLPDGVGPISIMSLIGK